MVRSPAPDDSSRWSLWSRRSLLSIGCTGSVLSIASDSSVLSIGSSCSFGSSASLGSFLSAASAGSSMSVLSVLSNQSDRSLLSHAGCCATLADGERGTDGRPLLLDLALLGVTALAYAAYRTRRRG